MTLYDDDADSFYSAESIDLDKIDVNSIELLYLKDNGFQLSDEEELKIEDPDVDKQQLKFVEDHFPYSLIDAPLPTIEEKSRESLESRDVECPQRKIKLPKLPSILPKMPTSISVSTLKRGFDKVKNR